MQALLGRSGVALARPAAAPGPARLRASQLQQHPYHSHNRPSNGAGQRPMRAASDVEGSVAVAPAIPTPEVEVVQDELLDVNIGYIDVQKVMGMRVLVEDDEPRVEYLVAWKDGSQNTWERPNNLSEDLVREYEERWWSAARKGDETILREMLAYSKDVLSQVVDENRRSALHFAAALGRVDCTQLLLDAGADPDLQDREGFTPLHMAAGYMHTGPMTLLLEAGSDPELRDNNGRDVVGLVENLRTQTPLTVQLIQRRLALEEVGNTLVQRLYEDVPPANILAQRTADSGEGREFLLQYVDDRPDEWLAEDSVAADIIEDWEKGFEFAEVSEVLDMQQWGTEREFLVKWSDGSEDSWEPEEHLTPGLLEEFQRQRPDLFAQLDNKRQRAGGPVGRVQGRAAEPEPAAGGNAHAALGSSNGTGEVAGTAASKQPVEV